MRLAPENGTGVDPLEEKTPKEVGALPVTVTAPPPSRSTLLQELIQQAMLGTLPVRRPLKPEEPEKFHTTHIAMIYDSLNGHSAAEVAARYGYAEAQVARVMAHPFTEVLEAALLGKMADDLTDPLQRMRAYSHEAIDVKVQIMRDPSTPKTLRNKVAADFLDRVGYGSRKTVEIKDSRKDEAVGVPQPLMERFVSAMETSNEVRKLGFGAFVKTGEGGGAVKAASAGEGGALPSATTDSGGASPAGGPPTLMKDEAAA